MRRYRLAATLAAAVALSAVAAGCEAISTVSNVAGNVTTLANFSQKLKDTSKITYTAEYELSNGTTVKLVQQPPSRAYLGANASYINTADSTFFCQHAAGAATCQKAPATDLSSIGSNVATAAGQGFVSPELAIALLGAASLNTEAKIETSEKTVAGQKVDCAAASGFNTGQQEIKDFTICLTSSGVMAEFSGTLLDGNAGSVTLTKYSESADASAFQPPAGAKIVDVQQINPN